MNWLQCSILPIIFFGYTNSIKVFTCTSTTKVFKEHLLDGCFCVFHCFSFRNYYCDSYSITLSLQFNNSYYYYLPSLTVFAMVHILTIWLVGWKFATWIDKRKIAVCHKQTNNRKQLSRGVLRKGVLKIYSKFTGEHPCRKVI